MLKFLLGLKSWAWALLIIGAVIVAAGVVVGTFFLGRWRGKTDFKRFIRRRPKPIDEEEYYGIDKEIDRRIDLLTKWLSVMRGKKSRVDVSDACMELMKLYDLRQYLGIMQLRDRAAARLYARDFLDKRRNDLYDLYEETFGFGEKVESGDAQTVAPKTAPKKTTTPRKKKSPDETTGVVEPTAPNVSANAANVPPVDEKKDEKKDEKADIKTPPTPPVDEKKDEKKDASASTTPQPIPLETPLSEEEKAAKK